MAGKENWIHLLKRIAVAAAVGIAIMLLLCALGAWLMLEGMVGIENIAVIGLVILLLGSIAGGYIAGSAGEKGLFLALGQGLLQYIFLWILGAICFRTGPEGTLVALLPILGGSMAGWLMTRKGSGQKRHRTKRYKIPSIVHNAQ